MKYKCCLCKLPCNANDGRLLHLLPAHVARKYPVLPKYATTGTFHLHRNAASFVEDVLKTHGNGEFVFRHLLQAMGPHFVGKTETFSVNSRSGLLLPCVGGKDLVDKSQPELTDVGKDSCWEFPRTRNTAYALKFKEKDTKVTAGEECQHSCESVRVVPSSREKAREIALGPHEMKKQSLEQLWSAHHQGRPDESYDWKKKGRAKRYKWPPAGPGKELEEAYRHCQPLQQGEFYRLSKSPETIVKVVQVHEGDNNWSVVRKYDQRDRQLSDNLIWDIPDKKIGYFVRRNTGTEPLPSTDTGDENDYAGYSTEEEPPKKKRTKGVLAARRSEEKEFIATYSSKPDVNS
eukprot:scaffold253_cov72-Cylindrotheca_fusiformis.AAC.3